MTGVGHKIWLKVKSSPVLKRRVSTFDGDEMNMHVPQSVQTATELKYLASVLRQIISPRTNSPIIQIFQDTLTGSYRISQPGVQIPEHIAMNLMSRMRKPISGYIRKNKNLTGAEVISTTFPLINHEGRITIKDGQLVKGVLKKGAFGAASEGIIYSVDVDEIIDLGITKEDVINLALLNWMVEEDSLACFV